MMPTKKAWRTPLVLLIAAVAPLLIVMPAVYLTVITDMSKMAARQIEEFKPIVMDARKAELKSTVRVAQNVIKQVRNTRGDNAAAKKEALDLLRIMDAGDDFYLFVYDMNGISLMHPRLPSWEGTSKWEFEDKNGKLLIQELIQAARRGGDYVEYVFLRPETGNLEPKLGYAETVPHWNWMIGTGLYLDQLRQTNALIKMTADSAVTGMTHRIVLVALLSVCVVSAMGLGFNFIEQRRANAKLRAMAQKVVLSQEVERGRVARELHDGISQWLASVKFMLESALVHSERNSPETTPLLRSGLRQMRDAMREVRRISHDLRPTILDDLPLSNALEQTAREFGERSGIAVETVIQPPMNSVPDAVATAVFRLTQEALGNIERHARASRVRIELVFTGHPAALCLQIGDDGSGFNVEELMRLPRAGLGLTHMRERIEMLGGRFEVTSGSGGTTVAIHIPAHALKVAQLA